MAVFASPLGLLLMCACAKVMAADDPGDMIQVVISNATIGVLLDEVFPEDLSRMENHFLTQNDSFWFDRVYKQLSLTLLRLTFRADYYEFVNNASVHNQLILPPDNHLTIAFAGTAALTYIDNHVLVARNYSVTSYIVGLTGTAAPADPALGAVGGCTFENFSLPVDPQLIVQRTGYACMNEATFPLNSVESESVTWYFDDTCEVEPPQQEPAVCVQCHCTVMPNVSCVAALQATTGVTSISVQYCRTAWNEPIAQAIEALNPYPLLPYATGADLTDLPGSIEHNWIIYRYYTNDSCERKECLPGVGWRKLLLFDGIHMNVGDMDLDVGPLSYTHADPASFNELVYHNEYYWDSCHQHPHFSAYASYAWGNVSGHKQGFCLETTNRQINTRQVPITTQYSACTYQGISVGWSDSYNGGIPCQWVDITDAPSDATALLSDTVNPKNWLCEGQEQFYPNGSAIWPSTGEFTTVPPYTIANQSIDKQACSPSPSASANNMDAIPVYSPPAGWGYLTSSCLEPGQTLGSLRDCEFQMSSLGKCDPGYSVTLTCYAAPTAHVVRVCEASHALNAGTACRIQDSVSLANGRILDSFTLANVLIPPATRAASTAVTFTCPSARDDVEVGGLYAVYTGAQLNGLDQNADVTCVAQSGGYGVGY